MNTNRLRYIYRYELKKNIGGVLDVRAAIVVYRSSKYRRNCWHFTLR